jgi:hypothetical protein
MMRLLTSTRTTCHDRGDRTDQGSRVDIETPCSTAATCSEDKLNTPEHDNPAIFVLLEPGLGHSEFVPHKEDWFRDATAGKRTPDGRRRRRALERCWNDCPVRARLGCLEAGLAAGPGNQWGIWGGYTEEQREQIIAARAAVTVTDEE